jgi:hypothetical protein
VVAAQDNQPSWSTYGLANNETSLWRVFLVSMGCFPAALRPVFDGL